MRSRPCTDLTTARSSGRLASCWTIGKVQRRSCKKPARTWAAFDRLRDPGDPLPYVRRTVVNLARSGLRRRRTARKTSLQAVPDAVAADVTFVVRGGPSRSSRVRCAALPRRQRPVCRAPLLPRLLDGRSCGGARHRRGVRQGEPAPRTRPALGVALEDPMTFTEHELRDTLRADAGIRIRLLGDRRRLGGRHEAACAPGAAIDACFLVAAAVMVVVVAYDHRRRRPRSERRRRGAHAATRLDARAHRRVTYDTRPQRRSGTGTLRLFGIELAVARQLAGGDRLLCDARDTRGDCGVHRCEGHDVRLRRAPSAR